LFACDEARRDWVLGIEEVDGASFFDRLFTNFLAFDEDIECSFPPLIAVVADYESHRVRGVNREVEGEPIPPAASRSAHNPISRGVFALHVIVAFGLHFPRLSKSNRGEFKLVLTLAFSRNFGGLLDPTFRRI